MGSYVPPSQSQYDPHGRSRFSPPPQMRNDPGAAEGSASRAPTTSDADFDILEWYPAYQSCQQYFLDHAQHEPGTQALCALINIRLPYQNLSNPITSSSSSPTGPQISQIRSVGLSTINNATQPNPNSNSSNNNSSSGAGPFISLIPYIRRLVVTGFDKPAILHGFFGDSYARGVLPHVECERRNYLFAAKSGGWRSCKKQYDIGSGLNSGGSTGGTAGGSSAGGGADETVPFMKPLDEARAEELTAAEKAWSDWLRMEDWMVGPRASAAGDGASGGADSLQGSQQTERGGAASRPQAPDQLPDGVPEALGEL